MDGRGSRKGRTSGENGGRHNARRRGSSGSRCLLEEIVRLARMLASPWMGGPVDSLSTVYGASVTMAAAGGVVKEPLVTARVSKRQRGGEAKMMASSIVDLVPAWHTPSHFTPFNVQTIVGTAQL
ncbi:hypothetical protein DFH09DRAFT_1093537 [Mycena vulgaris]|nr:hypothetical protein DFH09DRAFT_1093537 [Mycena vulgaris]